MPYQAEHSCGGRFGVDAVRADRLEDDRIIRVPNTKVEFGRFHNPSGLSIDADGFLLILTTGYEIVHVEIPLKNFDDF